MNSPSFSQKGLPPHLLLEAYEQHVSKNTSTNLFSYHQCPSRHHSGCGPRWWHQHFGKVAPTPTHLLHHSPGAWSPALAQGLGVNTTNPCWLPHILSCFHSNLISSACSSQNGLFQTRAYIVGTPPLPALKLLRELASPYQPWPPEWRAPHPKHLSIRALPPSKLPPAPGRLCSSALSECPQYTPPIGDYLSSRFQPALTPQPGRPGKTADVQSKLNSAPAEHSSHFVMMPSRVGIFAEYNPPHWLDASCGQGPSASFTVVPSAEFCVWH